MELTLLACPHAVSYWYERKAVLDKRVDAVTHLKWFFRWTAMAMTMTAVCMGDPAAAFQV